MKVDSTTAGVGLALLLITSTLPAGIVGVASAEPPNDYTIVQGSQCWEVEPWEPGDANPETGEPIRPHVEVITHSEEGGDFRADGWDGSPTIESVMAYRYRDAAGGVHDNEYTWGPTERYNPWLADFYRREGWEYGTYGLWNWSTNQESHLFLYHGPEGDSLVVRHDKLYDSNPIGSHDPYNGMNGPREGFMSPQPGGGAATFIFRNLPAGEWAYMDDLYPEGMDAIYYAGGEFSYDSSRHTRYGTLHNDYGAAPLGNYGGGTDFTAHWTWGDDGTDGGAYRGLQNLAPGESVVIEPYFNEESYFWSNYWWRYNRSEGDGITDWVIRRKNGENVHLDMDQPVRITRGGHCLKSNVEASPDPVEAGQRVTLEADSGANEYRWDFDGDGQIDANTTDPAVAHTYNASGDKQVTVTMVADSRTVDASTTVRVGQSEPPTADFRVDDGEGDPDHHVVGETVAFNGTLSRDNVALTGEYRWTINGTTYTGPRVQYSFPEPGDYEVTLSVTDRSGKTDNVTKTVSVVEQDDPMAEAAASPTEVEAGAPITLDGSASSDDHGAVVSYEWSAPGGSLSDADPADPGASVTYGSAGEYRVNLTVTDNNGNTDTDGVTVVVRNRSDPEITGFDVPNETSVSASVAVSATATDNVDESLDYTWTFVQDERSERRTGPSASYSFDDTGEAVVRLVVEDDAGNDITVSKTVEVTGKPNAELAVPGKADPRETVLLDASNSSDELGEIVEYRWDFDGDGEVDRNGTNATVNYQYVGDGTYHPSVTVVDDDNQTDTASASIEVDSDERAVSDSGAGSSVSSGPPPIRTATERTGASAAAIDVKNVRSGKTIDADLPRSEAANRTAVRFRKVAIDVSRNDPHVVFHTAASAEPPGSTGPPTGADEALAYLRLNAKYLDGDVRNATVEFTVQRSALGRFATVDDVSVYHYDGGWTELNATVVETGDDAYRLKATAHRLGTLAVGADRPLAVTGAMLANESVTTGGTVTATATVENAGDDARTATLNLTLDGGVVASKTVEVAAGGSREVTLTATAPTPGTYEATVASVSAGTLTVEKVAPADTAVADVSLNESTIEAGEQVAITATVENTGDEAGEQAVTLTLFGEQVASETVTVPGGETKTVTFTRRVDAAGNYTVEVNGEAAELGVTGANDGDGDGDGSENPSLPVPGFGVGAAVAGLLAAVLLARLRS